MTRRGEAAAAFERLVLLETDEHVLWPFKTVRGGYGILGTQVVSALALARRIGARPTGMETCHAVGCPRHCMNYRHLRWGTHAENEADKQIAGTVARGMTHGMAKLTTEQVLTIRTSTLGHRQLAREIQVSEANVRAIRSGKTWGWLLTVS